MMKMLVNLVIVVISLMWGFSVDYVGAQTETYTDCRKLPNILFNYALMVDASPFLMLRSTRPWDNCTTGLLTGPSPLGGNSNHTFLLIRGNTVTYSSSVDSTSPETVVTHATTCAVGDKLRLKFLPYNLTSPNPYYVIYECDQDTGDLTLVRGYARNLETGSIIDGLIKQYLVNIPGGDKVTDMWANCQVTPFCGGFFNQ